MPSQRTTLSVLFAALLSGCASPGERSHQNFKNTMQLEVGKPANDRYLTRNEYPSRLVGTKPLPTGNVEEEFKSGRGLRCRTFFAINKESETIVRWRYEGSKDDCAIVP